MLTTNWGLKAMIAIAICGSGLPVAAEADSAVIVNSGSTNTAGFKIAVERSGNAEYAAMPRRPLPQAPEPSRRPVPNELAKRLYADLEAAKPLSSLPRPRCAKSASFGSRLTIEFGGSETPDLSCGDGDNPKLRALIHDTNDILAIFSPK